ncbi:unnamed protein product [Hymenolepis diminuta]|uniref:Peptidase A2 domain-containing protein n=1 Tax=Hymenolepis diminuta TaxID=6216 RepID=A0A564Y0G4_HYMDI|nr:unnamed protein product [Hymenolepis diminuta]
MKKKDTKDCVRQDALNKIRYKVSKESSGLEEQRGSDSVARCEYQELSQVNQGPQVCIGDSKPIALLNRMKLLASGESFDMDFWKILHFKKLPSSMQPILANALKKEPIESLADMADNIFETAGPPRSSLGKRGSSSVVAETVSGHSSNRLFLQDRYSGTSFLIDFGAEISVIPPTAAHRNSSDHPLILAAANGSPIKTYSQKSVTLDLGLRRTFRCIFTIADVSKPIIGADFLCHFGLLLGLRRKKLLDPLTSLHTNCTEFPCPTSSPITCIQLF